MAIRWTAGGWQSYDLLKEAEARAKRKKRGVEQKPKPVSKAKTPEKRKTNVEMIKAREKKKHTLLKAGYTKKEAEKQAIKEVREEILEPRVEARAEEFEKAQIEEILKERKVEREEPIEEPIEEGYIDPETGEPLYSGTVTPLTASDLTDTVTMFTGLGFLKVGGKTGFKKLIKKAGTMSLSKAETEAVKKGMLNTITRKVTSKIGQIGAGILIGQATIVVSQELIAPYFSQRVTAEDRQIRSIDTAMSQVRETITLPVQLVKAGATIEEGLDQLDSLRDTVAYGKQKIKELEIDSYEMKTNPEFTMPMKLRIAKLEGFLDLSERVIITAQVSGEGITEDALMQLMTTYEELFGEGEV